MWYKNTACIPSNFLYVKDTVWQEIGGYFLLQSVMQLLQM